MLDNNGWTVLQPSADTRKIYVSSSTGNDANNGSESSPIKRISKAFELVRDGYADWVLLKKGDTFIEGRTSWYKGGRSAEEPMIMTSYGTGPRPVLKNTGFIYWGPNGGPNMLLDHLSFIGLEFRSDWDNNEADVNQANALLFGGGLKNLLIEDCAFFGHKESVQIQFESGGQPLSGLTVRRSIFADSSAQGILTNSVNDILIEENIFDRIGWKDGSSNIFRHGIYIKHCKNCTVRKNIFSRNSNFGSKFSADNPDGFVNFVIEDNLYIGNGIGIDHSSGPTGNIQTTYTHRDGKVANNVFTDIRQTFGDGSKQDLAAWLMNSQNVLWSGNIFAHKTRHADNVMLAWNGHHNNIKIENSIVFDWNLGPSPNRSTPKDYFQANLSAIDGFIFENNELNLPSTTYVAPERTISSYWNSLGNTSGIDGFLLAAKNLSKDNWDTKVTATITNDYIRKGFEHKVVDVVPVDPPIVPPVEDRLPSIRTLLIKKGVLELQLQNINKELSTLNITKIELDELMK